MIEQKKNRQCRGRGRSDNLHRQGRREENLQDRRDERPDADSAALRLRREVLKDIETTTSPLVSFLLTFCAPADNLHRTRPVYGQEADGTGGRQKPMAFGFGKSDAKVYVPSTQGIHFSDVAGEDEAKESLSEIVDYLHNPKKYSDVGASMPKGVLLVGLPEQVKQCSRRLLRAKECAVFLDVRFGIRRDVRRHGRFKGQGSFQPGKRESSPA